MIEDLMVIMNDIKYGYMDNKGEIHNDANDEFSELYKLQSPQETLENKIGVCWDQVELERYLFKKKNIEFKTYFIVHYDNDRCPTHTFLIYKDNNKYYWFEHSWERFRGIHEYQSLKELLFDIRDKFIKYELDNDFVPENLVLHEYKKPKYHISVQEFYNHCDCGTYIDFEQL